MKSNEVTIVMEYDGTLKRLLSAQRNEVSEYHTYAWLAKRIQEDRNREVLHRIAKEELDHYEVFRRLAKTDVKPQKLRVFRNHGCARKLSSGIFHRVLRSLN